MIAITHIKALTVSKEDPIRFPGIKKGTYINIRDLLAIADNPGTGETEASVMRSLYAALLIATVKNN